MKFICNLNKGTIESFKKVNLQNHGYLLSSHRSTSGSLNTAHEVVNRGLPLFSDNGTKEHIEAAFKEFRPRVKEVHKKLKEVRRLLGRTPRGSSVPKEIRRESNKIAQDLVDFCTKRSESIDSQELLKKQLEMRPTHLILQEDFSVACLIGLGLERSITGWSINKIDRLNKRSIKLTKNIRDSPNIGNTVLYTTLGAMDFNSARSAGRIAVKEGLENISIGMVGIMRDPMAVERFVVGKGTYKLQQASPRRYVRLVEVVSGLIQGYRDEGGMPKRLHALGLGAAPALPLLARIASEVKELTVDASSPIHDAVKSGALYERSRLGDRVTRLGVLKRIIEEDGDWLFDDPFSKGFRSQFGHAPQKVKQWWIAEGKPDLLNKHISDEVELEKHVPYITKVTLDNRRHTNEAHIAQNHLVISEIAKSLHQRGVTSKKKADKMLDDMNNFHSSFILKGINAGREVISKVERS